MPQPQQHQIQAASVTCATAHGDARALTHWGRPGMEPATSWLLIGFVSAAPRWELPGDSFSYSNFPCLCVLPRVERKKKKKGWRSLLVTNTGKRTLLYTSGLVISVSVLTPVEFQRRPIWCMYTHKEGMGREEKGGGRERKKREREQFK